MPRTTRAGRLIHGGRVGRLVLLAAAVASALAVFAISEATGERFGEAILFGFVISLTLAAGGFGLRGGLVVGILCSGLAAIWWMQHEQYEGTAWIVSRTAACISVGVLLGWFLDQARRLLQDLAHHHERLEQAMHERTIELERTTRELAESHHETLTRLALAAEYRDDDTQAHTYRVADTAARIAHELGLDGDEVKLIREAALLHDVGKVGIPDAILLKAGPLSGEEFDVVKTHPEIGRSILAGSRSGILRAAEEIAAFHHEWWDGSGYPYGLVGEAIPLTARIVALADVYDALTHSRPYKPAWPRAEALAEVRRLRGAQFDPDVVDAFEQIEAPNGVARRGNGIVVPLFAAAADAAARVRPSSSAR
jgi:putative nucleotidyltransferase with HDIG domain